MLKITSKKITQALESYQIHRQVRFAELFSNEDIKKLRPAAVIIPLLKVERQWNVLLTQRSQALLEHRGQVAFPGGAKESADGNLQVTALREMKEEIGIDPKDVHVYGHLGDIPVITGYMVRLFIGQIPWPYKLTVNHSEVESTFIMPLEWLINPGHRCTQFRSYSGREIPTLFFEEYHGYQLWGASAEMMMVFLRALDIIN